MGTAVPVFIWVLGDPNSGLNACKAVALPLETSLRPLMCGGELTLSLRSLGATIGGWTACVWRVTCLYWSLYEQRSYSSTGAGSRAGAWHKASASPRCPLACPAWTGGVRLFTEVFTVHYCSCFADSIRYNYVICECIQFYFFLSNFCISYFFFILH